MDTISIKITAYSSSSKAITIVRKYNKSAIGEIKSAIDQGNPILEYSYLSHSGTKKIAKCYDELQKAGITCEIYDEFEELISRDILLNLIHSQKQTEHEVEAQIDTEIAAEETDS